MKRLGDQAVLVAVLLTAAILTYIVHVAIFQDVYHVFFYGIMDVAFLPISVLLVTLVINRLLSDREHRALLNKLDMVIGVFYTEVGTLLLREFSALDAALSEYQGRLSLTGGWTAKRIRQEMETSGSYSHNIDVRRGDLAQLKALLHEKRGFLLRLLENPNLLEHETFTELLLAVTHVAEELDYRVDFGNLPPADYAHLSVDVRRAYALLIREWLTYMQHLQLNYPYLFSLAVRTNPFDPTAKATVTE